MADFSESAIASVSTLPLFSSLLPGEEGRKRQKSAELDIWTVKPLSPAEEAVVVVAGAVFVAVAFFVTVLCADTVVLMIVVVGLMSQIVPWGSSTHLFVKRLQQLKEILEISRRHFFYVSLPNTRAVIITCTFRFRA